MECSCITAFSRLFCSMGRLFHFLRRFRWHILFWIAYFIGWTWLSVSYYHNPKQIAFGITLSWFLGQATMISLIAYRWVPRLLRPRRLWLFVSALVSTILVCAIFSWACINLLLKVTLPSYTFPYIYVVIANLYWTIIVVGIIMLR